MLLLHFFPQIEYNRESIRKGNWLLLFSSHFSHWDLNHLIWDASAFILLGTFLIKENKKAFYKILLISPWFISLNIWLLCPEIHYYRGASGIASALFVGLALTIWQSGDKPLSVCMLLLLTAKIIFEYNAQSPLFTQGNNYITLPLAHLAGAIIGVFSSFKFPLKNIAPQLN